MTQKRNVVPKSRLRTFVTLVIAVALFGPGCSHMVEFAVNTWKRRQHAATFFHQVIVDNNGDGEDDLLLFNAGFLVGTDFAECRILDFTSMRIRRERAFHRITPPIRAILRIPNQQ